MAAVWGTISCAACGLCCPAELTLIVGGDYCAWHQAESLGERWWPSLPAPAWTVSQSLASLMEQWCLHWMMSLSPPVCGCSLAIPGLLWAGRLNDGCQCLEHHDIGWEDFGKRQETTVSFKHMWETVTLDSNFTPSDYLVRSIWVEGTGHGSGPTAARPMGLTDHVSSIGLRNMVATFTQHLHKTYNTFIAFDSFTCFLRIYPKWIILTVEVVFCTKRGRKPMESRIAGDPVIGVGGSCYSGRERALRSARCGLPCWTSVKSHWDYYFLPKIEMMMVFFWCHWEDKWNYWLINIYLYFTKYLRYSVRIYIVKKKRKTKEKLSSLCMTSCHLQRMEDLLVRGLGKIGEGD